MITAFLIDGCISLRPFFASQVDRGRRGLVYFSLHWGCRAMGLLLQEPGRIAQLEERFLYTEDVAGSSPVLPTSSRFRSEVFSNLLHLTSNF